jgi:hypothetical protein
VPRIGGRNPGAPPFLEMYVSPMPDEFFEPPAPEPDPGPQAPPPPWSGPPNGVLPGVLPLEIVLAANDQAAVFIGRCGVYPVGFELEVRVLLAGGDKSELEPSLNGVYRRPGRSSSYESMLRFGLEFPDGGRVTNVGGRRRSHGPGEPDGPVLSGQGGGGGGGRWRQDFWVWPLPVSGMLGFVCEWPAAGIAMSRVDIDAALFQTAAARSQILFPNQDAARGGSINTWSTGGRT